ncbi:MAG: hypothetical protein RLN70_00885, partial [Rhodospirillaceae bacterium]
QLGNVKSDFASLLNRLEKMRENARYGADPLALSTEETNNLLSGVAEFLRFVKNRAPTRVPLEDPDNN